MSERTNDEVLAWMHEVFPGIPITALLGATPVSYDTGRKRVVIEYEAKPEFCNLVGTVQGGMLTAMLDNAMTFAVLGGVAPGHVAPTLEIKTSYVAPARRGRIVGEGAVVRLGRTVAFIEGRLRDADGTVVAVATGTAQLRRPKAGG